MTYVYYRQNKSPSAIALGDWFPLRTYFLISKASPNDKWIIVIVVIIVGEAKLIWHGVGIIAQRDYLKRVFLLCDNKKPRVIAKPSPSHKFIKKKKRLKVW